MTLVFISSCACCEATMLDDFGPKLEACDLITGGRLVSGWQVGCASCGARGPVRSAPAMARAEWNRLHAGGQADPSDPSDPTDLSNLTDLQTPKE